ncbi:MAG: endonuclease III [Candidatus Thorarchaeota archaeon]|nr:endonuclease III [Candidatus Thorarchaeota archaeon]
MEKQERALAILKRLEEMYPDAPQTYLDFSSPFELTIATILSAHTTDRSVNSVTPQLFKRFSSPQALASAPLDEIKEIIRPVGAYNRKAVYIQETARGIVERFGGVVPSSLEELVTLKGISRKTANVILSTAFGIDEGVVVDTHIRRVTNRLGLSEEETPKKIERDLMTLLPQDRWRDYARLISAHGRRTCVARSPKCAECGISELCPSRQV